MEQYQVIYMTGKGINRSVSYLGRLSVVTVCWAGGRAHRGFAGTLLGPMLTDAPLAPTRLLGARKEVPQSILQALRQGCVAPSAVRGNVGKAWKCREEKENGLSSDSRKLCSAKSKETAIVSPLHPSAVLVLHSSISPAEGTSHPGMEQGSAAPATAWQALGVCLGAHTDPQCPNSIILTLQKNQ